MKALLNRLLVWQKLAVLGVLGLLLTGVPSSLFLMKGYDDWAFARQERSGMEPAIVLLDIIQLTQQHRGFSSQLLGGRQEAAAGREDKKREVEQAIAAFEAKGKPMLADPKVAKTWATALQSWRKLESKVSSQAMTAAESHIGHTLLVAEQLEVLGEIRDSSLMTFDPAADGYFLHIAGLADLPNLSEQIGQLRSKGTGLLATQTASEADRVLMRTLVDRVRYAQKTAFRSLDKVAEYRPQVRTTIAPLASDATSRIDKVTGLAEEQIVRAPSLGFSANEYRIQTTDTIDSVFRLLDAVNLDMVATLDERMSGIVYNTSALFAGVLLLALLAGAFGVLVARSITRPVRVLTDTVHKFEQGDATARANLQTQEELGELGRAFDKMMAGVVSVDTIKKENDDLNNSVLNLLQGVAQLARKDLTVKVTVAEDVTGPVADALNLLTTETAKVMQKVSDISADVTQASLLVKQQSDTVQAVADAERRQAEATAASLDTASQAMARIAELAQVCNSAGERATQTTQQALVTVNDTVGGINNTRDTIRETEKRIKRLGERSQEISVAVNLINTIAERTHILALNAAMHAASAGEAGRGFAVVADEVQRLAESARQATQQIAGLVGNIQVETADTVNTMNAAITQVVEGSKLAEQAGQQMQVTQSKTAELVASVQRIAEQSQEQAQVSKQLIERAAQSKQSSQKTHAELLAQSEQTGRLVEYAKSLITAVRVFKLSAG